MRLTVAVEERAVVRGDEERAAAPAEVLLEPLEGGDVEVVRRLVEQQQVGVGDHEAGEGRAGLLPARQRRRRLVPLLAREPEAGQRLVDALVERVPAEDLELVLQIGVGVLLDSMVPLEARRASRPSGRGAAAPWRTAARRSGAAMNSRVEVRLLGEQAERQAALAMDLALIGLVEAGRDPEQGRLAGAVRADEADPVAERDGSRRCCRG